MNGSNGDLVNGSFLGEVGEAVEPQESRMSERTADAIAFLDEFNNLSSDTSLRLNLGRKKSKSSARSNFHSR